MGERAYQPSGFYPAPCKARPRVMIDPRFSKLILALLLLPLSVYGQTPSAESPLRLTGKLVSVPDSGLVLRTAKKDYPLSARTSYLLHTLQDQRLADREVRLEGTTKADGRFEVAKLFTLRDGK